MKPAKTLLTAVFGISLALAAFVLLNIVRKGDAGEPRDQVLAAAMELSAGTLLRAQDITWQAIRVAEPDQIARPAAALVEAKPEIVEETAGSVYGAVLRHPVGTGTALRRGDIARPGDRDFLQLVLSPGTRAIAIPVATGGASTGLLTPGDHVDVILTQNFKNESQQNDELRHTPLTRRSVGETVVQNLRVLAIDAVDTKQNMFASNVNPANGNFGRTVTLEVTPDQAETINVAAELGKLSLTLRSNLVTARSPSNPVATSLSPVTPKWAGDVSPALVGAAIDKPVAVRPKSITVLRGIADKELRAEIVKPDADTRDEQRK